MNNAADIAREHQLANVRQPTGISDELSQYLVFIYQSVLVVLSMSIYAVYKCLFSSETLSSPSSSLVDSYTTCSKPSTKRKNSLNKRPATIKSEYHVWRLLKKVKNMFIIHGFVEVHANSCQSDSESNSADGCVELDVSEDHQDFILIARNLNRFSACRWQHS